MRYATRYATQLQPATQLHVQKQHLIETQISAVVQGEDGDTIFEHLVREDTAAWQHWRECVPTWTYPKGEERPKFAQLVIPTLDSVRYEKLLGLVYSVNKVHSAAHQSCQHLLMAACE